jgi:hypothetical protein
MGPTVPWLVAETPEAEYGSFVLTGVLMTFLCAFTSVAGAQPRSKLFTLY